MNKQTSVIEWLQEQYHLRGDSLPSGVFQEAKEMHKQEIIDAYTEADTFPSGYLHGKDYYEKTFLINKPNE